MLIYTYCSSNKNGFLGKEEKMVFWIVLATIAGAGAFIAGGYFAAKTKVKEKKEVDFWAILAVVCIVAGAVCSWRSIDQMRAITIGRAGTPGCLDKATFYRALSTGENLSGKKFVDVQNAADETFQVTSNIQPQRGDFLRVTETPAGLVLEIIEPNNPVSK